jgi:hypothetical protein
MNNATGKEKVTEEVNECLPFFIPQAVMGVGD